MSRIDERALVLPALYVIKQLGNPTTTEVKAALVELMRPTGEDAEILAGRKDTKFTQIVRNLLGSHYDTNDMALLTDKAGAARNSRFTLTGDGEDFLAHGEEAMEYLAQNRFDYDDARSVVAAVESTRSKKRRVIVYSEEATASEGRAARRDGTARARSRRLRDAAISHYALPDGRVVCHACGFDFLETYGELGEGYIQIHHESPLCQYSDEGFEQYIPEAVKKMKPLCANCHCMLHRRRDMPLTVDELRVLISSK